METPDSLLIYQFPVDNDSLIRNYIDTSGILILSTIGEFSGEVLVNVIVTDDSNSIAIDSVLVQVYKSTGINNSSNPLTPNEYMLYQSYPNPFNPSTKIKYTLPKAEKVKIEVFNLLGQRIETLINKQRPSGSHEVEFTSKDLPSGVYLYRIEAGEYQEVKKMILMK